MSSDVMKMMKDNNVKFVDFRFTDTRGKEQHVSVPSSIVDEDLFKEGKPFGSIRTAPAFRELVSKMEEG